MDKMSMREREIISFICYDYCQFCDNNKCNAREIMEKYQSESLTLHQLKEVNEFELDGAACKNHVPNEGFSMFIHKIEVHYMDGRVERKKGWYSSKAISEMWDEDIEFIRTLFTEV